MPTIFGSGGKMILPQNILSTWDSTTLTADRVTAAIDISCVKGFALYTEWSAGVVGSVALQGSLDPVTTPASVSNWSDISGSSVAVSGANSTLWNVSDAHYTWVRIKFTFTSGTGTMTESYFHQKASNA